MNAAYKNYLQIRDELGLSDYQVSKNAGISRTILSDWKNNKHYPHASTLKKIADCLGVNVDDFYQYRPDFVYNTPNGKVYIEAMRPNNNQWNQEIFSKMIRTYTFNLKNGEKVELNASEYKELMDACEIFIDSWIRSKKGNG